MTFNGGSSFSQTATNQAGNDYTLALTNFGGKFEKQKMSYKGKFVNVQGTAAKNLTVSLEKKLKSGGSWAYVTDTFTNTTGRFYFNNVEIDTTAWDVRIAVKGDTMKVGSIVSVSDAQRVNQYVLGTQTMAGFDYYTSDANGDKKITISDVYSVYGRVGGRFTSFPNSVQDVLFFTESEYNTINNSNANKRIIDVTTFYDDITLQTIEVNYPKLGVDADDVVSIPVKIKTGGIDLGSLQLSMRYDSTLLTFKGVKNEPKTSYWISFINPSEGVVEWGGYDPTNNKNLIKDGEMFFTLEFTAKKPQNDWGKSPLYVTRKFAGNASATDLIITPTDGIIQVFRMAGPTNFKDLSLSPNPSDNTMYFSFKVYQDGKTSIGLYDMLGREQIKVVEGNYPVGIYSEPKDISMLAPGLYMAILRTEEKVVVKKAIKNN